MVMPYLIIFNILKHKDNYEYYNEMIEVMDNLPGLILLLMNVFSKNLADKRDQLLETKKYRGKVDY